MPGPVLGAAGTQVIVCVRESCVLSASLAWAGCVSVVAGLWRCACARGRHWRAAGREPVSLQDRFRSSSATGAEETRASDRLLDAALASSPVQWASNATVAMLVQRAVLGEAQLVN